MIAKARAQIGSLMRAMKISLNKAIRIIKAIRYRRVIRFTFALTVLVLVILLLGNLFEPIGWWLANRPWSGFGSSMSPIMAQGQTYYREKTLWDWLQLCVVPLILLLGGILLNWTIRHSEQQRTETQAKTERWIAEDRAREQALLTYIDRMSSMLLESDPKDLGPRKASLMRTYTLTVLRALDGMRKGAVLQFLYDAGLIFNSEDGPIIDLADADASGAVLHRTFEHQAHRGPGVINVVAPLNLSWAYLKDVNFTRADLRNAFLGRADLTDAKLTGANMEGAKLAEANLYGALLIEADLTGADLRHADLSDTLLHAANLSGADLTWANMEGAKMGEVDRDNSLMRAAKIGNANIQNAVYNSITQWPPGFDPERAGAVIEDEHYWERREAARPI